MENWGLSTYRESGLLFDPEKSSSSDKLGITKVIAHELAHQVDISVTNLILVRDHVQLVGLFHKIYLVDAYITVHYPAYCTTT